MRAKFAQNPKATELLKSTGDAALIKSCEVCYKCGFGEGSGFNRMGKILMRIRESLQRISKSFLNYLSKAILTTQPDIAILNLQQSVAIAWCKNHSESACARHDLHTFQYDWKVAKYFADIIANLDSLYQEKCFNQNFYIVFKVLQIYRAQTHSPNSKSRH